uniref:Uncharacterized protein n=1 Tax=Romanomermis culicivorax TaxID=13658 RepID=A0A915KN86_ROMCU
MIDAAGGVSENAAVECRKSISIILEGLKRVIIMDRCRLIIRYWKPKYDPRIKIPFVIVRYLSEKIFNSLRLLFEKILFDHKIILEEKE